MKAQNHFDEFVCSNKDHFVYFLDTDLNGNVIEYHSQVMTYEESQKLTDRINSGDILAIDEVKLLSSTGRVGNGGVWKIDKRLIGEKRLK
jgi:hypothetical protein